MSNSFPSLPKPKTTPSLSLVGPTWFVGEAEEKKSSKSWAMNCGASVGGSNSKGSSVLLSAKADVVLVSSEVGLLSRLYLLRLSELDSSALMVADVYGDCAYSGKS